MYLSHLRIIITVYIIHHLVFTGTGDSPVQYYSVDDIAINCGSSGSSSAFDGREWIGDMGSTFTSPKEAKPISVISSATVHQSLFADSIPNLTARISHAQFTYTFQLRPGQKFIRLLFYPASYPGFETSKALFNVKAGQFTLLNSFSPSITADALGVSYFAKEFCVNIEENQVFHITITPSKSTSYFDVYAFINRIEIVSMPAGLYYTANGDLGAFLVGNKFRFCIDNGTALEMVHRLNVGGRSILSVEDFGMFRMWSEDKKYLLQSSLLRVSTSNMITYKNMPTYVAPFKVYQTGWSTDSNQLTNQAYNFTWNLPVDLGFRYLVKLHFCELQPMITDSSQKQFDLLLNNKMVEIDANVIKWSGGNGVAIYRDYVVMMEGDRMECRRDLIITLQLKYVSSTKKIDPILKGIEIFKLTNPDNNLACANPVFRTHASRPRIPKLQRILSAFSSINFIVTGAILILTLLNFIVYHLNILQSNSSKINILSSLDEEELHRHFSLLEIQLATNNFDDGLVIGKGGFGNVYKGLINKTRCVAIKRLNLQSKQGAQEFWAEINALSDLRHNHLVSLIGYCDDCLEMILVYDYEYMAHGTLADHLHKGSRNGSGDIPLSWEQQLNISIGAARGLDFLHTSSGAHHGIIHRDVKSSNILLDENWVAKISDFRLSKLDTANASRTHISTNVKGTFGYLDPEYFMTRRLTKKSDIYALGVVLFEVLCGRRAVDLTLEDEQHSLALWAPNCIRKGKIDQLIDPSMKEQISPYCLRRFVKIANKCLHDQPNERPTRAEIVARLDLITSELHRRADSSKQGAQEFWAEINALSDLRHNHLVSLIGYCDDCLEMILVYDYEYMAHGTLADHLHKGSRNGSGDIPLSWEQQLNISIGAARGLDFLHTSSGAHHGIIHRDVKSSNILLDENWVAKISDFRLSKLDTANASRTHISTNVKGTFGYLDPEYFMTRRLTKKSDIYALGVVLFEVLCGRRAVDLTLEDEQHSLALWAPDCIRKGKIDQLIDPSMKEQISPYCLRRFVKIANKCLHDQPNERPTRAEIVARLDLITSELHRRADSYIEQEIIDVGGTCNESIDGSISSENSLSMSGHYSIHPIEVINENMVVESISHGPTKNTEFWKQKKDYDSSRRPSSGWRVWDTLWHR
ncbi:receptor-like protein kinase FERONIA [Cornus florida]|uniref:receptor-like protein kinase FERONIA n=1 Tax=Cornus florida TaxID=4283 RepID=UPI00289B2B5B|nr:receptor-like protein kinase FERONIA [Cornus florida]